MEEINMTIKEFKNEIMGVFQASRVEVDHYNTEENSIELLADYDEDNEQCCWASTLFRRDPTFDSKELVNVNCLCSDGKLKMVITIIL